MMRRLPRAKSWVISARRAFRSAVTGPRYSSGTVTSRCMTGSSNTMLPRSALLTASAGGLKRHVVGELQIHLAFDHGGPHIEDGITELPRLQGAANTVLGGGDVGRQQGVRLEPARDRDRLFPLVRLERDLDLGI